MRPILEYGSSPWDPHFDGLNIELEKVQTRAAWFVTRNYTFEEGSMTDILAELKWETLQKRMEDNRLSLLYKSLKGKARIPTDDLIPKIKLCIWFGYLFNVPVNNFSVILGWSHRFLGIYQYFGNLNVSCSRTLHGTLWPFRYHLLVKMPIK